MAKRNNHALLGAALGSVAGYFGGAAASPHLLNPGSPVTLAQREHASTGVRIAGALAGALLGHYVGKKV